MDITIDLSSVNSLFNDDATPFDVMSWFLTREGYYGSGDDFAVIINGRVQMSYFLDPKTNIVHVYIPFRWSSTDQEIKIMYIKTQYSTNTLDISLIQVENYKDIIGLGFPLGSIFSRLVPGYNNVGELMLKSFIWGKKKSLEKGIPLPGYAASGKTISSALFAIGRLFRFKWLYAMDDSTINCGIPFLIYRLLAGKNTYQESLGFTQINNLIQLSFRSNCNYAINNLKSQLIDPYLQIAPSLYKYRGYTVGDVFMILNSIYELDDCEDVKRLVQYFIDNTFGTMSCYSMEYIRPVMADDYPPK